MTPSSDSEVNLSCIQAEDPAGTVLTSLTVVVNPADRDEAAAAVLQVSPPPRPHHHRHPPQGIPPALAVDAIAPAPPALAQWCGHLSTRPVIPADCFHSCSTHVAPPSSFCCICHRLGPASSAIDNQLLFFLLQGAAAWPWSDASGRNSARRAGRQEGSECYCLQFFVEKCELLSAAAVCCCCVASAAAGLLLLLLPVDSCHSCHSTAVAFCEQCYLPQFVLPWPHPTAASTWG